MLICVEASRKHDAIEIILDREGVSILRRCLESLLDEGDVHLATADWGVGEWELTAEKQSGNDTSVIQMLTLRLLEFGKTEKV